MEWVSILPPLLAIFVVIWKKEVISALFAGIFLAEFLLLVPGFGSIGTAWLNSLERIVGVFTDGGNARLLVFSLMIGALLAFVTTANAGILAASRYPLALSRDELLPKLLSRVNGKSKTPIVSICFTGIFIIMALQL